MGAMGSDESFKASITTMTFVYIVLLIDEIYASQSENKSIAISFLLCLIGYDVIPLWNVRSLDAYY